MDCVKRGSGLEVWLRATVLSVCTCLGIIITSTSDGFRISDILLYFYLMLVCAVAVLSRLATHFNLFVINDLFKFPSLLS